MEICLFWTFFISIVSRLTKTIILFKFQHYANENCRFCSACVKMKNTIHISNYAASFLWLEVEHHELCQDEVIKLLVM